VVNPPGILYTLHFQVLNLTGVIVALLLLLKELNLH